VQVLTAHRYTTTRQITSSTQVNKWMNYYQHIVEELTQAQTVAPIITRSVQIWNWE